MPQPSWYSDKQEANSIGERQLNFNRFASISCDFKRFLCGFNRIGLGDDWGDIYVATVNQAHSIGKFRVESEGSGDRDFLG